MDDGPVSRAATPPLIRSRRWVPFTENAVGLVLVPVWGPVEPQLHAAARGIEPFQAALVTVTVDPVCVYAPDQRLVIC